MKKWRYCILILIVLVFLVLPVVSLETGKIAFVSNRDGYDNIYVMDANGDNPTQLTFNPGDVNWHPAWSPDGTKIAFSSNRQIYVMDANGANPTRLTNSPDEDRYPAWSPDGLRIAFASHRDGDWEIYAMDTNGANPIRLTTSPGDDRYPSWSPHGTKIAFASLRDGENPPGSMWEIYVMDANGANPTRLTNSHYADMMPVWSPDDTKIAFVSERDGDWEIYVMDTNGANPSRLTNSIGSDAEPTWSPDGNQIAFRSSRNVGLEHEIYVMDANGANPTRLTDDNFKDMMPAWGRVPPPPTAAFAGMPRSGTAPLAVQFTDKSIGSPSGWAWYFGDETYSDPWTQVTASAGWSARIDFSSVVMPDGSIVLMGGHDSITGSGAFRDVWRSKDNGTTWMQMTPSAGWSARWGHSSVVMGDGSIVLMGGYNVSTDYMNDVWRSMDDGATWTQMTANAGWLARDDFSSVVMGDGSIVLMGGTHGANYLNDTWRSTDKGATWNQMTPSAGWSARWGHSSVVMQDGSIVLMGGYYSQYYPNSIYCYNDVWRSKDNGATWMQMTPSAGWSARSWHSSVVMPDDSIVLMGGQGSSGYLNDVWRSKDNGTTWMQMTPSAGWSGRFAHSGVMMPDGSIVLMGGHGNNGFKNDVWRLMTAGSSAQSPSHTYTTQGIYNVALQVFNSGGFDSILKTGYITVKVPTTNIPTKVKIVPNTINLGSKGYFLAFVTLPEAYKGATIDMKMVSCSGAPAVRMMKMKIFPRTVGFVFKTSELKGVESGKRVILPVMGELKNKGITYSFTGAGSVKVINKPSWQPDDIKDVSKVSDDQIFKQYST